MTRKHQKHILTDCFPPLPRLPKAGLISLQKKKKRLSNKSSSLLQRLNPACPSVLCCNGIDSPPNTLKQGPFGSGSSLPSLVHCFALTGMGSSCCRSLVPQGCPALAPAGERSSSQALAVRLRHGAVTSRWQLEIAEVPLHSGTEGNLGFL